MPDSVAIQKDLAELRLHHQVALISEAEEGYTLPQISRGAYGFTYAPGQESIPVYRKKGFQSFEVHRLPDGSHRLVGFVSPGQAEQIARGVRNIEIHLYPEPWGDADRLVHLLFGEILLSKKGPSRSDGNPLDLR